MLERAGVTASEAAMVGDRLYTDIAGALNCGLTSILVLSGETKLEHLDTSDVKPHLIFGGLGNITPLL